MRELVEAVKFRWCDVKMVKIRLSSRMTPDTAVPYLTGGHREERLKTHFSAVQLQTSRPLHAGGVP
jgi:hypothetical protein